MFFKFRCHLCKGSIVRPKDIVGLLLPHISLMSLAYIVAMHRKTTIQQNTGKERNKPEEQECSDRKEVEDQENNTTLIRTLMEGSWNPNENNSYCIKT